MSKLLETLPNIFDDLPPHVKESLEMQTGFSRNKRDIKGCDDWLIDIDKWKYPPVSVDTFLYNKSFLDLSEREVYPTVRKMVKQIVHNDYREAVVVAGIGSGKTYTAQLVACYYTHKLLCMRNPHKSFNLSRDKPITIINMGTTATQALLVAFNGIKTLIQGSEWFLRFKPVINKGSILFPENNILLMSGNSKSTTPLGYNVFCAILDEADFYMDNEKRQIAAEIYTTLRRRIVSRFGWDGLIMAISSPKYEDGFVMKKLKSAKEFPKVIYGKQLPIWKCKPPEQYKIPTTFWFNSRQNRIVNKENIPTSAIMCRIIDPFDSNAEFWEIPGDYEADFIADPDMSKRDYAAIPSAMIEAFMGHAEFIREMFTTDETPVVEGNKGYVFSEPPLRTNYYIHIDLALNKKKSKTTIKDGPRGDRAGLAMAHFDGWEKNEITGEMQKKVKLDLVESIEANMITGEVDFGEVRNKIYVLQKMGYNIALVTLDQYNSADTMQILRGKGIRSDLLSVDRLVDPYNTFKELIYTGRVKCHKMELLYDELRGLEISKGGKIDHMPSSSKDASDAACGAVYNVMMNTSNSDVGMSVGGLTKVVSVPTTDTEIEAKKKHYIELQRLVDQGVIK